MQLISLSLLNFTYLFIFLIVIMYCISYILRLFTFMILLIKLNSASCEVNIAELLQPTICHVTSYRKFIIYFLYPFLSIAMASGLYFFSLYTFLLIFTKIFLTKNVILIVYCTSHMCDV